MADQAPTGSRKRRLLKKAGVAALASVLLLGLLILLGLARPHWFLQIETRAQHADVIIVLGGEPVVRVERAVALYRAGVAPRIIVSGQGDCWINVRQLTAAGVPRSAILVEETSRTTLENARFCAPLLARLETRRAVVVTSWYHSRRALACFEAASPGVEMLSLPARDRTDTPRQYIVNEYLKLGYYTVKHGIWPIGL